MIKIEAFDLDTRELRRELTAQLDRDMQRALEEIGRRVIRYLKSYTNELRPPLGRGRRWRKAHPGHWANVTRELMNSYGYEVVRVPTGWSLRLFNTAKHAVYLEEREGYFVLSGALARNGPLDRIIRQVIRELKLNWEVR